ncbi:hypothetical protein PYW07_016563 [Mythimna separata]|uniref:Uncharacterized protein n=1 Tax=Mythimna separata TaxID=271217 RepID=A0AAD7YKQ4_MYTSE|nr:hypothetical protein PYW07_016563 [Mythimna separata]
MDAVGRFFFIFISVYSIVVELDAVTVNPALCPTNKIAPHRRQASWEQARPRTLGLIYNLLAPGRPQSDPLNDLQEQPQEDDQDDCGEIEDYDETDLSSVTQNGPRRKTDRQDRYYFGNNYIPPYYPGSNKPPSAPYRPQRPTRPPYNFEGIYGPINGYRPPSHQYPGHIKPVKEDMYDHPPEAYRPGLIGGILGHVVGFPSVRPPIDDPPLRDVNNPFRFPEKYSNTRRKKSQHTTNKSTSIIGSFVDLLFN